MPDVPARALVSVTYAGSDTTIKAGNAFDFTLQQFGATTLTLTFDGNAFFDSRDVDKITTTGGLQVTGAIVPGSSTNVEISVVVPEMNEDYSLTFPLSTVSNGQLEYSVGDVTINLKGYEQGQISDAPVAAKSAEALKLYTFLKQNYRQKTLSGMMAKVNWNYEYADSVGVLLGKTPLINGFDYIHMPASENGVNWVNYRDITPVKEWDARGGLVQINWHWTVPTIKSHHWKTTFEERYNHAVETDSMSYANNGNFAVDSIFSPNATFEKYVYEKGMTTVIEYLTLLKEAGIPVLWRPYHEAAGQWFWWGQNGAETFKKLWVDMFNRFKNAGLDNLIWVWTSEISDIPAWYPGNDYVDIVGCDVYGKDVSTCAYDFKMLRSWFPKIATLSETGVGSTAHSVGADGKCAAMASITEQLDADCGWSWFMPWYDSGKIDVSKHHYADEEWQATAKDSRVLWLGDYTK